MCDYFSPSKMRPYNRSKDSGESLAGEVQETHPESPSSGEEEEEELDNEYTSSYSHMLSVHLRMSTPCLTKYPQNTDRCSPADTAFTKWADNSGSVTHWTPYQRLHYRAPPQQSLGCHEEAEQPPNIRQTNTTTHSLTLRRGS
ncbi:hypothetical protein FQN60_016741, partial [Etheostoma spectabile]